VILFEPRFTYHGFRYASISELWWISPGELCEEILGRKTVEANVRATDLNEIGHVTMDSNEWNAIERACVWSTRSNLMGVPTDCPQRDVRLPHIYFLHVWCSRAICVTLRVLSFTFVTMSKGAFRLVG
jgi:alpha-L-rhamnosidase